MAWYWWVPIYVVGALVTFRLAYLNELDSHQRNVAKNEEKKRSRDYGIQRSALSNYALEADKRFGFIMVGLATAFWPVALVILGAYFLAQGVFWIMFPRGIKTKFDREQQLEREKKEAEIKYQEARELLAKEGIEV